MKAPFLKAAVLLAAAMFLSVGPVKADDFPKVGQVTASGKIVAVGTPVVTRIVIRDAATGRVISDTGAKVATAAASANCPCDQCDCGPLGCPTGCPAATKPATAPAVQYALPSFTGGCSGSSCSGGQCNQVKPTRRGLFR